MNDNVEILRRYNRWRRGQALWSATADLPDPRVVGEAIDAACDEIERLRVQVSALEAEREDLRCVIADISVKCASLCAECDQLRAELAECRRDAERYRWLRGDAPDPSGRWPQWEVRQWKAPMWTQDLRRDELDAAIDAAMKKEAGKEETK